MTSPLPPRRRDTRGYADLIRQDRQRLSQLDRGLVGGRFPPARPLRPAGAGDLEDDESDDFEIQFSNTDHGTCSSDGAAITIALSHVPEDGSEQVFYGRTPLDRSEWTRTDTTLTVSGQPWFRAGKRAWVNYAYYDVEPDTFSPFVVGVTTIVGLHSSIDIPARTSEGDILVLALGGGCSVSDARMDAGYQPNPAGITPGGLWLGRATATQSPLVITTTEAGSAGALMSVSASPATVTQDTKSTGTGMPFSPTLPAGSAAFGIAAIFAGSGLVAGQLQADSAGKWTTQATAWTGGSKTSVYIGTCDTGIPSGGSWQTAGSDAYWGARIVGVQ